ncbi:unnamed protein product [Rangifer tarandus platyrhynchus]|uniref:Uncharacterized protein n=1 Tax=Rangifer tarandus platyrhynchus TaxID=3082113 RepID=A0AC59Z139_RANTA
MLLPGKHLELLPCAAASNTGAPSTARGTKQRQLWGLQRINGDHLHRALRNVSGSREAISFEDMTIRSLYLLCLRPLTDGWAFAPSRADCPRWAPAGRVLCWDRASLEPPEDLSSGCPLRPPRRGVERAWEERPDPHPSLRIHPGVLQGDKGLIL